MIHFHFLPYFSREAWQISYFFSVFTKLEVNSKEGTQKKQLCVMLLCFKCFLKFLYYDSEMKTSEYKTINIPKLQLFADVYMGKLTC